MSDLNPVKTEVPQRYFTEKVGQMVGFSGSITLSKLHENLSGREFDPAGNPGNAAVEVIKTGFVESRTDLVRFVALSFVPGTQGIRDKLPTSEELHSYYQLAGIYTAKRPGIKKLKKAAYEPYRKFYVARQKDLDVKTHRLRTHIEKSVAGLSSRFAQLSKLDVVFDKVLAAKTRSLFEVVPQILGRQFECLYNEHIKTLPMEPAVSDIERWMQPDKWIGRFCGKMRELLIAELEVRLQPVLGMVDALSESDSAD